jgi:predicted O-methyltransferase YrrM
MLSAVYRYFVRRLPVSLKSPLKRAAVSVFGSATSLPAATSRPAIQEAAAPVIDPLQSRVAFAEGYFQTARSEIIRWARNSRENDNFTYDLSEQNLDYLAATISVVTGSTLDMVRAYLEEPEADLSEYLRARAAALPIDKPASFGRRLGWYAIARAIKPRVIIETGVHHGIGSVLLGSALRRNFEEGHPGKYYGTDIDAAAGSLLAAPFDQFGKILHGDSIESLQGMRETIDLFINDSDHSAEYEAREYRIIESRLSQKSIILGDNAHFTNELFKFSASTGRQFLFFKEQPKDHWYPGAGIGISFFQ